MEKLDHVGAAAAVTFSPQIVPLMYWLVICHALRAVEKQVLNLKHFFAKRTCLSSCIFSIYMENEDNIEGIILELYHQLQIR